MFTSFTHLLGLMSVQIWFRRISKSHAMMYDCTIHHKCSTTWRGRPALTCPLHLLDAALVALGLCWLDHCHYLDIGRSQCRAGVNREKSETLLTWETGLWNETLDFLWASVGPSRFNRWDPLSLLRTLGASSAASSFAADLSKTPNVVSFMKGLPWPALHCSWGPCLWLGTFDQNAASRMPVKARKERRINLVFCIILHSLVYQLLSFQEARDKHGSTASWCSALSASWSSRNFHSWHRVSQSLPANDTTPPPVAF